VIAGNFLENFED